MNGYYLLIGFETLGHLVFSQNFLFLPLRASTIAALRSFKIYIPLLLRSFFTSLALFVDIPPPLRNTSRFLNCIAAFYTLYSKPSPLQ